jgi:hypothetical protein
MEQLSGDTSQSNDVEQQHGGSGLSSTDNQIIDTGCSSSAVASACEGQSSPKTSSTTTTTLSSLSSSSSSDRNKDDSNVRRMPQYDAIQNTPASPSVSSSSSSRDGSEGNTETERDNDVDSNGSKKETSRLRKGKWTVRTIVV